MHHQVQKKAKCVIGKDYPKPIVDHGTIHKENIARMKVAYEKNREAAGSGAAAVAKRGASGSAGVGASAGRAKKGKAKAS